MSNILVRDDGAIRVITMNRPDKKNALTQEMYHAMAEAMDLAPNKPIRCIVIAGGPARSPPATTLRISWRPAPPARPGRHLRRRPAARAAAQSNRWSPPSMVLRSASARR